MEGWREYHRLRNWARLSILAIPVFVLLIAQVPELLAKVMSSLGKLFHIREDVVLFVLFGLWTIAVVTPIMRWIAWRCPRCGKKFAIAHAHAVLFVLGLMAWKLIVDSPCSACGLECGG